MNLEPSRALFVKSLLNLQHERFRWFDITFWPLTFFLSVTLLTTFLTNNPGYLAVSVLGAIGWRAIYHFSTEISRIYMDDYWSAAIEHLMVAPVRTRDFVIAGTAMGTLLFGFVMVLLFGFATMFFPLPPIQWGSFLPALAVLAVFGVELGVILVGANYYFGDESFSVAFLVSEVIAVLSGPFYPLAMLPGGLKYVAMLLPSAHAFSLIKSAYGIEGFDPTVTLLSLVAWAVLSLAINKWLYAKARKEGKLLKLK